MDRIPIGALVKEWVDGNGNKRQTIEWDYEVKEEITSGDGKEEKTS